MDSGVLRVSTPDGQVREYPLDVAQAFIGRAEGNRVVIDHISVSRRHARLDFVNGQALLEDLESATGTFVSGQRLNPGTPRPIAPNEALRFGDCEATLLAAAVSASTDSGAGGRPGTIRPEQAVSVSLTAPNAPLVPGSAATATVVVQNRSTIVDTITVSIDGIPDSWLRITRPSLQLMPDARDEVVVIIQPPRDTSAVAGAREFAAKARSTQHNVEVRAIGSITVLPFGELGVELRPRRSVRAFTAELENRSNSPASVTLKASDPAESVEVTFQPDHAELAPGQSTNIRLTVRPRKAALFGKETFFPFEVEANADARAARAGAELRYRPPWLWLRWVLLLVLVAAAAVGGWFAYSAFTGEGDDSDEAQPSGTTEASPTVAPSPGTSPTARPATQAPGQSPTAAPQTTGLQVGGTAVVTNSPVGDCLFLRPYHTRQASDPRSVPIARLCDGERVTIIGGRVEDEGYVWYQVRTAAGQEGWSAEGLVSGGPRFLTPAR